MKLLETLEKTLKKEPNFITDNGELKKWVIINKAQNYDDELIELLLSEKELQEKFFKKIKDVTIFNQTLFIQFLEQKNYLNDSYTQYKNKVGLTIDGKYLKQRNEVALVWPFKDCILEGGQSKEEQKRDEIFFNEILAQDEITQLLEPKVLTNAKRYNADGEKKLDGFNRNEKGVITDNLIIKGNNLLALHTLKKDFEGKVKLIYIDPPYNTGSDGFNYNDNFNHSSWLTFMKNRLLIAKKLLRNNGVIFINIDDDEGHYLKILCDEIFGRDNFIANIVWQKKYTVANDARYFSDNHDHILVFANDKEKFHINGIERSNEQNDRYRNLDNDPKGAWMTQPLHAKSGNTTNFEYIFSNGVKWSPPRGTFPRYSKENLKKFDNDGSIWFGKEGNAVPRLKKYLNDMGNVTPATIWLHSDVGSNDQANKEIKAIVESDIFSTPKPEKLLQKIIHLATLDNDLILDFFCGSGTTGAVAHKMNRQYILIEQMGYIHELPEARLKQVIAGEQGGISKAVNWQGGGSFVYLELKKYNETFIEQIEKAKDTPSLLQIWEEMKKRSFLNYNVDIKKQDEHIEDFKNLTLKQQKEHLCEVLDKNQLFVNLSSMDDNDFACTDEEKRVTKDFYGI